MIRDEDKSLEAKDGILLAAAKKANEVEKKKPATATSSIAKLFGLARDDFEPSGIRSGSISPLELSGAEGNGDGLDFDHSFPSFQTLPMSAPGDATVENSDCEQSFPTFAGPRRPKVPPP